MEHAVVADCRKWRRLLLLWKLELRDTEWPSSLTTSWLILVWDVDGGWTSNMIDFGTDGDGRCSGWCLATGRRIPTGRLEGIHALMEEKRPPSSRVSHSASRYIAYGVIILRVQESNIPFVAYQPTTTVSCVMHRENGGVVVSVSQQDLCFSASLIYHIVSVLISFFINHTNFLRCAICEVFTLLLPC